MIKMKNLNKLIIIIILYKIQYNQVINPKAAEQVNLVHH